MTDLEKMLAEATPGPWAATERETQFCIHPHDLPAAYQGRIADVIYWRANHTGHRRNPLHGEAASNARLMALAPSLAAALLVAERALREISRQKKTDELETEYDVECADFEGGYDACVDTARAAISEIAKLTGGGE